MKILIIITALILDGVLSVYIPLSSKFLPLLTLTTVYLIYPLYKKKEKQYFLTIIIVGIMYDLLYTNLLFFHAIIFFLLGRITKLIYRNLNQGFIKTIIYTILIIIAYELITFIILYLFRVVSVTPTKLLNKITSSLLTNLIYASVVTLLLRRKKLIKES